MALNDLALDLVAYVDEHKLPLIRKSLLGDPFFKYVNIQDGILGTATINVLETEMNFQAGGSCNTTPSGVQKFTQREIKTCQVEVYDNMCLDTLTKYYTSKSMKNSNYNEEFPFPQVFSEELAQKFNDGITSMLVKGDTMASPALSGVLGLCDGVLKIAREDENVEYIDKQDAGSPFTRAAIIATVNNILNKRNVDTLDRDTILFMSHDIYMNLVDAYVAADMYHYKAEEGNWEFTIPGKNAKAVASKAFAGTNAILAVLDGGLYVGTSNINEMQGVEFKMWFSNDLDKLSWRIKANAGINYAFSDETILYEWTYSV